jgi:hypothetical protein
MNIGPKTIEKMKGMAGEQLDAFAKKINEAFLKADDGKLKVTIAFDIAVSETKKDAVDLDATISFVADRIKDKVSSTVVENQVELPLEPKVYKLKGGE